MKVGSFTRKMKFSFLVLLFGLPAAFGSTTIPGPAASPATVWHSRSGPPVRVRVDGARKHVAVTVSQENGTSLKSIGITFFDADGNSTMLVLKATEPGPETPLEPSANPEPTFAGTLSPAEQSFVGFQVEIPFHGSEAIKVIHSDELDRSE